MAGKTLLKTFLSMAGISLAAVSAFYVFTRYTNAAEHKDAREVTDTSFKLPAMPVVYPALMVKLGTNDTTSVPLKLSTLKMDVKVVGNLVYTTMEMSFYNSTDRDLEGQFYFPLAEGQSVIRFAMDVNNELREGVVVEKAKGRATFESVIRKGIDPGLLEWTKGNNFKARIFPIPAKMDKRIIVGYTHELLATPTTYMYWQPMAFKDPIPEFEIKVSVLQQESEPMQRDQHGNILNFKKDKESWVTETKIKDYLADKPIAFEIPATELNNKVFVEEIPNTDSVYFYTCIKPQKFERDKKLPGKIGLIWDVSASGEQRDLKKEMKIINDYLAIVKNAEVVLIPFANEVLKTESFTITNGNCTALNDKIKKLTYDGGTQMGCLDLNKYKVDEFLMFTDGISNFGKQEPVFSKVPVNTFVSAAVADYSFLKYIAQKTNGVFINGIGETSGHIAERLKYQAYRFSNSTAVNGNTFEVYPSIPTDFNRNFTLAGRMKGSASEIKLTFGFGAENIKDHIVKIDKKHKVDPGTLSRAWAQKKLDELDLFPERNIDAITALGLKYSMITRNTSLLVLDRVEDYVEHHILPPPGKMRTEYLAQVTKEEKDELKKKKAHLEEVVTMFNARKEWWNTTFEWPKKEEKKPQPENTEIIRHTEPVVVSDESTDSTITYNFGTGSGNGAGLTDENVRRNYSYSAPGTYQVVMSESGNSVSNLSITPPVVEEDRESNGEIELKKWEPDAAYVKPLKNASKGNVYQTYLKLRSTNKTTPAYYFDASDILISKGMPEEALRVLSNIAELELENHELLRTLAHRLQQLKKYELSIYAFKDVLKIREEEPQSYRDLGLVYADNKNYQEAVDMLCKLVNKDWDGRFPEIELIAVGEVNQIIAKSTSKLDLKDFDQRLQKNMKTDIRVVIDWDSDNCDMDLWITDPTGEKTYYGNRLSKIGGELSRDFTGGYGPEEFMIKRAMPGKYLIQVDYFGSHRQTVSGPTTVQAKLITNSGTKFEKRKEVTIRLKSEKEVIDIGELVF